jgi:hypothetical protein
MTTTKAIVPRLTFGVNGAADFHEDLLNGKESVTILTRSRVVDVTRADVKRLIAWLQNWLIAHPEEDHNATK